MVALLIFSLSSSIDTVFGFWHLDYLIVDPHNFKWMRGANSPVVSQQCILFKASLIVMLCNLSNHVFIFLIFIIIFFK